MTQAVFAALKKQMSPGEAGDGEGWLRNPSASSPST